MLKIDLENQILALIDSYFWLFNKSDEKINTIFVISEMFLLNSVDLMKNLLINDCVFKVLTIANNGVGNQIFVIKEVFSVINVFEKIQF